MTADRVVLTFNPTDFNPGDLKVAQQGFAGSVADQISSSLMAARILVINEAKRQAAQRGDLTAGEVLHLLDLAWQFVLPQYRKTSAPLIANAYYRAYRSAKAGNVPMSVIYALADQHAERLGDYFHQTSREALVDGFQAMVNRRVPARVALDQMLDGYGLSTRQSRGYVNSAPAMAGRTFKDLSPDQLKARALSYIGKAFRSRVKLFAEQEEHNVSEQAKQAAWMWLQETGKLSPMAQKVWITARDERVCPTCGPLHNKRVLLGEQFEVAGGKVWTPGIHPNCRCTVRIVENRFSLVEDDQEVKKNDGILSGNALHEFNQKHPRAGDGKFRSKPTTATATKVKTRTKVADPVSSAQFQSFLDDAYRILGEEKAPPKVSTKKVTKVPKVTTGGKVSSKKVTSASTESAQSQKVGGKLVPKQKLARPALDQKKVQSQKIRFNPEKVRESTKIAVAALAGMKAKAVVDPVKQEYRDAMTVKLEKPLYVVIDPWERDEKNVIDMQLEGDTFDSEEQAIAAAHDLVQARIDSAVSGLQSGGGTYIEHPDLELRARIDDEDLHDVVWVGSGAAASFGDDGDMFMTVHWQDDNGDNQYAEKINIQEIADQLEVRRQDFGMTVAKIEEGHDSDLGATEMRPYGRTEEWSITGQYDIEDEHSVYGASAVPIKVARLSPKLPD